MFQEFFCFLVFTRRSVWKGAERLTKRRKHFLGMADWKEIDRRCVLCFEETNFQFSHEPSCRHPEVIPHHHDALDPSTIALPQGFHQFRVFVFLFRVQPLFELVKHDQNLLADGDPSPMAQRGERFFQRQVVRQRRTTIS